VSEDEAMRNHGIGSWPARQARKVPQRIALRAGERVITYAELHERVTRLAHGLRAIGAAAGDRVAYLGPNHPAFLETFFATGTIGAVFVPLNTRLAAAELEANLADAGATVLVHGREHAVMAEELGQGRSVVGPSRFDQLIEGASDEPIDHPVTPDDPCLIMFTSGTTGRAKGAVLSHANITWNSLNVLVDADLLSDEVTLLVAPLFHTAGLNMTCLPTLLKGGQVVLEPTFEPDRVLELIERHRITFMFAVPPMYDAIARSPRWPTADLSSLRTLTCGGAPVPLSTIRTYQERGLAFIQGYGMTEASPGVLLLDRAQSVTKAGSAGVPHFFTDVRIVRPDLVDCRPGEAGEVLVGGPNVMRGYWNRPDETSAAFTPDGVWFRSGDVAVSDVDGYVTVVDRIKDMIISGGENVYPAEVEQALADHPAVAAAAVIGVPDERWGEVGRAFVILRTDSTVDDVPVDGEALREFLVGRIANYKIPKTVQIVTDLPRNAVGKILRSRLRDLSAEGPS
jgi:fatty-acyl-CoA synthase